MGLPADLLEQAYHLARRERRRPRQASLRRAVATAYYALFHQLVEDAMGNLLGKASTARPLRQALGRACSHAAMAKACRSFEAASLPSPLAAARGGAPVHPDMRQVARTFLRLQKQRHLADYDLNALFNRVEALRLVALADSALATWKRVRRSNDGRLFLACLVLWDGLKG
ncbi:MAG: hypothetical protein HYU66_18965 [Armatimonadetes bacterium]|nr:hypothetical protein [Armatimonadota bacterium]